MRARRRKCRCCRHWFYPQAHNAYHQRYCTGPACRRASKRVSQRCWLRKNPGYYRDSTGRVRTWRAGNPRYWRRRRRKRRILLRVDVTTAPGPKYRIHATVEQQKTGALQELSIVQRSRVLQLMVGLDSALREMIFPARQISYPWTRWHKFRPLHG